MMGKIGIALTGLAVLLLAGCAAVEDVPIVPIASELPTAQVQTRTPANISTPSPSDTVVNGVINEDTCPALYTLIEMPHDQYRMEAYLDVPQHTVQVAEKIAYTNRADDPLTELVLVIEPNRYDGVFQLGEVTVGGASYENYSLDQLKFTLLLPSVLPPGCSVELGFDYSLVLPEQAGIFGYMDQQIVLTNWYPFVAPYHIEWVLVSIWCTRMPIMMCI
ncbi:MAG: hypothetical protein P8046_12240 [Anaerolineales bacterium]